MISLIRGMFLDFIGNPFREAEEKCIRFLPDGLLAVENGKILDFGNYSQIIGRYSQIPVAHYPGRLILPGFIDAHVHYPQMSVIASYGEHLLEWLDRYVYPTEEKFHDYDYARQIASLFLDELLSNGITTAAVFCTVHPQSVDAFFEESLKRNMRMIAGKVMMSRNAPQYLQDTVESSYEQSKQLIEKWHERERLLYAVTPRFAITCPREQLDAAHRLQDEFPGVYLHTHISENVNEIHLTLDLFKDCSDYLQVYEKSNLVGPRSLFAHGVHLSDSELTRLSHAGAAVVFCPMSNLFLGSGLFNLNKAACGPDPVHLALGTDVGAGTSFSLLRTLSEAYKVAALQDQKLSAYKGFYLLTRGGAVSLDLQDKIGNFDIGKEADFVVLNPGATQILRLKHSSQPVNDIENLPHILFSLMCLGDERVIEKTYIAGSILHEKNI